MSSKMREAMRLAIHRGITICGDPDIAPGVPTAEATNVEVDDLLSRYGDLEFTREEVRVMLQVAYRRGHSNNHVSGRVTNANAEVAANEILSHHTEGEVEDVSAKAHRDLYHSMNAETEDDTPTIKASDADYGTTDRGFELVEFKDRDGRACQLQQSSAAEYTTPGTTALWLGLAEHPRMHLSELQVSLLCECMQRWLDTGSLVDGGSADDEGKEAPEDWKAGFDFHEAHLDEIYRRVAAIEKRVLADGHSAKCEAMHPYIPGNHKCTCHHDEIREARKV